VKIFKVILRVKHKATGKLYELIFAVTTETVDDAVERVMAEYDLEGCEVENTVTGEQGEEVYFLESKLLD
jgi:hypothetical protein